MLPTGYGLGVAVIEIPTWTIVEPVFSFATLPLLDAIVLCNRSMSFSLMFLWFGFAGALKR